MDDDCFGRWSFKVVRNPEWNDNSGFDFISGLTIQLAA